MPLMSIPEFSRQSSDALRSIGSGVRSRIHLLRYAGFVGLAIAINLLSQNAVLAVLGSFWFGIYVAIAFGNAAGLIFKFIVDKYWVFDDIDQSLVNSSRKFAIYAAFGLFTTLLFWTVELAFHYIFQNALMTNVGAVVGLVAGYVIKYNLDKHVTFAKTANAPEKPNDA